MNRATSIGSLIFNYALCIGVFVALSIGVPAHIESEWTEAPKPDAEQLGADMKRAPVSDEKWATVDKRPFP